MANETYRIKQPVYLNTELDTRLSDLADETGESKSELIRRGIRRELQHVRGDNE